MTTTTKPRRPTRPIPVIVESAYPLYELRQITPRRGGYYLEIWQLPSTATPRLSAPESVATLKGAALRLIEPRVLKRLAGANIRLEMPEPGEQRSWPIDEELALTFGLLFRTLAPMRNLDRIRQTASGVEAMPREEAAYWLGMAMNRKHPRRVLAALRMLLTTQ